MDRNVRRINGIKTQLHTLSEIELAGYIDQAEARKASAEQDLVILGAEMQYRCNVELPIGEVALSVCVEVAEHLLPIDNGNAV